MVSRGGVIGCCYLHIMVSRGGVDRAFVHLLAELATVRTLAYLLKQDGLSGDVGEKASACRSLSRIEQGSGCELKGPETSPDASSRIFMQGHHISSACLMSTIMYVVS